MKEDQFNFLTEVLVASFERTIKKLWVAILLLTLLLFGTNLAWWYYVSSWEVVETIEVTQDNTDGYNNYIGQDGNITNGATND